MADQQGTAATAKPAAAQADTRSVQQQTVDRVQALVDGGMQQSDAIKKVAEERGVKVSTVRGALFRAGGTRSKKQPATPKMPADPTATAVEMFRRAIAGIDEEIAAVQAQADAALAELEELKASADKRKTEYERKIKALA